MDGWTRFATTTDHPLTCGEILSDEVILERRNGPRRLIATTTTTTTGHTLSTRQISGTVFYDFLCSAVFVLIYPLNVDSFSMRMRRTLLLS